MPWNVFIQLSLIPLPQRPSAFLVGGQSPASEGSLLRGAVGACSLCRAGAGLVGADHNQEPNISCHTCVHPAARHMVAAQNCLQPSRATHSDFYPVQVVNEHLIFLTVGINVGFIHSWLVFGL